MMMMMMMMMMMRRRRKGTVFSPVLMEAKKGGEEVRARV